MPLLFLYLKNRSAERHGTLQSRLKNLPERYLPSVEALVRWHFESKPPQLTGKTG